MTEEKKDISMVFGETWQQEEGRMVNRVTAKPDSSHIYIPRDSLSRKEVEIEISYSKGMDRGGSRTLSIIVDSLSDEEILTKMKLAADWAEKAFRDSSSESKIDHID